MLFAPLRYYCGGPPPYDWSCAAAGMAWVDSAELARACAVGRAVLGCAWCGSQGYLVTSIILTAFLGAVIVRNFRAAAAWASIGAAASAIGLIHSYELKVPLPTAYSQ